MTVPDTWNHVGLLPAPPPATAPGTTRQAPAPPSPPGYGPEIHTALTNPIQPWKIEILDGILWEDGKPLDDWARKLKETWTNLSAQAQFHGDPQQARAAHLASRAVRSILLYGIGAFAQRPRMVTGTTPRSMERDVPRTPKSSPSTMSGSPGTNPRGSAAIPTPTPNGPPPSGPRPAPPCSPSATVTTTPTPAPCIPRPAPSSPSAPTPSTSPSPRTGPTTTSPATTSCAATSPAPRPPPPPRKNSFPYGTPDAPNSPTAPPRRPNATPLTPRPQPTAAAAERGRTTYRPAADGWLHQRDIARIIDRDPSLVSQFYTKGKGAAFVPALRQVLAAVETGGITDLPELAAIAGRHITRRTTASGTRARVRTKAVLISRTGTGRAGAQAIASGSARLRPLIAEAARQGLRLAFTVRLAKTAYLHPSGSRTDSPGIRRGVIQRADHTEERSYGSAQTGGFAATDFARRVDAAGGDVTAAVHQWLVETGRIRVDAQILHLEVRTWRPR
ncbi:hypothetical protein ACFQ3Z_00465 [Streptomyces nogalater]